MSVEHAFRGAVLVALGALFSPSDSAAQRTPADTLRGGSVSDPPVATVTADSTTTRRGQWVALPYVFYTPETGVGGGGLGAHYVRLSRAPEPSSFLASASLTARKQWVLESLSDAYLRDGTRLRGEVRYRHYPDVFYGIGPGTPESFEEDYTSRTFDLRASVQRRVRPRVRAGLVTRFRHEKLVSLEDDGLLAGGVRGSEGGTVVGMGVIGTWDSRDNVLSPRHGAYVEASWIVHDGLLGADFDFQRGTLDGRLFLPVGGASVLALQAYLEATPGRPPFSLLPLLGGQDRLRGYRQGRFRDRTLATTQMELRFPVWRRFGGAAFVAVGDVAPGFLDLDLSSLEVGAGAGLRFRMTADGVTLRGDYAVGREGGGLYLTIGQAF
jgi:outer membrane protein assembly factor BamA